MLRVIYLVFNEGYAASSGESLTRHDLSGEAIRLGRLLVELLPEPEAIGLLALMLLHESRRAARTSPSGELILLEDQDRSLWDREQIAEGRRLVERALSSRQFGPYTIQAAIAAVHAEAPNAAATDWAQIVGLYDVAAASGRLARRRAEPRRRRGDARRSGRGAGAHRRHPRRAAICRTTTSHTPRAPTCCRRLGRTAEARDVVRARARPDAAGARAAVSREAARRTPKVKGAHSLALVRRGLGASRLGKAARFARRRGRVLPFAHAVGAGLP